MPLWGGRIWELSLGGAHHPHRFCNFLILVADAGGGKGASQQTLWNGNELVLISHVKWNTRNFLLIYSLRIGTSGSLKSSSPPWNNSHAFFCPILKEKCVLFFSFKLYQTQLLPTLKASFDLSLSWEHTMDERSESNVLGERRAFTGPAHDKSGPQQDHISDCHPSDFFSRGTLKELITLHFLLPSMPNLCVFCPFPFALIPGYSFSFPSLHIWGFMSFPTTGALQAPLVLLSPDGAIPHRRVALVSVPFLLTDICPAVGCTALRGWWQLGGISHCSVPPATLSCSNCLWGRMWEDAVGKSREEQGSRDLELSPPWKNLTLLPGEAKDELVRVSTPQRQGGGGGKRR